LVRNFAGENRYRSTNNILATVKNIVENKIVPGIFYWTSPFKNMYHLVLFYQLFYCSETATTEISILETTTW